MIAAVKMALSNAIAALLCVFVWALVTILVAFQKTKGGSDDVRQ